MVEVNRIRLGLLIDEYNIPLWAIKMIELIQSNKYSDFVLIVKKNKNGEVKNYSTKKNKSEFIFYKIYQRIEKKLFKPSPDALDTKDIRNLLNTVATIQVNCIEEQFSDIIREVDIKKISSYNIDVFIKLGFGDLSGNILKSARFGIWSYKYSDTLNYRGSPPGLWEVFRKDREIGITLVILTEDTDGNKILYRSSSTIHRLLYQSLNSYYWSSSLFVPRKINELYELGEEEFLKKLKIENEGLHFYSNKLLLPPTNFEFLKLFISNYGNWLKLNIWKCFNFEQWILLYSLNVNGISKSINKYKRLTPPKDRFWADPCVIFKENTYFIFIEELIYTNKKAHLSVIEMDQNGIFSVPKVILKKPYHLSYPFVFNYEGEYYMIPETEENSTIELYHAVSFPDQWEFCMNLMENIKAVDTTLLIKDDKFWIFTNIKEIEGAAFGQELFIYSSDKLFSNNWKKHPSNPVIVDVKSARPAGRLFYYNDKLYRPSQDCSYKYGYSTQINEVVEFNEKQYLETKISSILPKWDEDVVATHTFSFSNNLTFIDAAIKRNKFS